MSMHNQRKAYGEKLVQLGKENPNIVVLEADLGKSTQTCMFEKEFPERFFEMGIAEQNMTSFAGGLSLTGKIAFTNTFAVFATGRAYDQIRQSIGIAKLNVKIVGSSSGLSDFGDGSTHQSIDDVVIMNAIPGMVIFTPCDAKEIPMVVDAAVAHQGPCYIRTCRNDIEDILPDNVDYKIGEPIVLKEGTDVAIISHGIMAHSALDAAKKAEENGISCAVIHLPTIKPINEEAVKALCAGKKGVVTVEENNICGGMGQTISYILRGTGTPIECVGVMDSYGQSAETHEELIKEYGLDADSVYERILKF